MFYHQHHRGGSGSPLCWGAHLKEDVTVDRWGGTGTFLTVSNHQLSALDPQIPTMHLASPLWWW